MAVNQVYAAGQEDGDRLKITKFGHACLRVELAERGSRRIVIDPGNFTDVPAALAGAEAILVTHEHADHIDDGPVLEFLAARHSVPLYAPAPVIDRLRERIAATPAADPIKQRAEDLLSRLHTVAAGEELEIAGFRIRAVGGQHEIIHPQIPIVANIGYIINDVFYHPGDSYIVPTGPAPHTLALPLNAPWAALEQTLDFMIAVRPVQVIPIHDGLLGDFGHQVYGRQVATFAEKYGVQLTVLNPGESIWVK